MLPGKKAVKPWLVWSSAFIGMSLLAFTIESAAVEPVADSLACVQKGANLLKNAGFSPDAADKAAWTAGQHAGEVSFVVTTEQGVLSIRKIATQPWFAYTQKLDLSALEQQWLQYSAELKLDLDAEGISHAFPLGGGLQIVIEGQSDIMGSSPLLYNSVFAHEPHLGRTDWFEAKVIFQVPNEASWGSVGFLHQAAGEMWVRNPVLRLCDPSE